MDQVNLDKFYLAVGFKCSVAHLSASKEAQKKILPNQKRTDLSFTLAMLIGFDDSKESNSNEDHNSPLLSVLSIKDKRIMKSLQN